MFLHVVLPIHNFLAGRDSVKWLRASSVHRREYSGLCFCRMAGGDG